MIEIRVNLHSMHVNLAILQLFSHAKVELEEVGVSDNYDDFLGTGGKPSSEFANARHQLL